MIKIEAPTSPEKMNETFAAAFNSSNVDSINSLFEENAKVTKYDKSIVTGYKEYNIEHINLLKLGGTMTSVNKFCIKFEDIALLSADWKIKTTNGKGEPIEISGTSSEVVRKQQNGTWLYIIDNPFGV